MSEQELIPCPWCKGAEISAHNSGITESPHFMACDNCGADGPDAKSPEEAIAKWQLMRDARDAERYWWAMKRASVFRKSVADGQFLGHLEINLGTWISLDMTPQAAIDAAMQQEKGDDAT